MVLRLTSSYTYTHTHTNEHTTTIQNQPTQAYVYHAELSCKLEHVSQHSDKETVIQQATLQCCMWLYIYAYECSDVEQRNSDRDWTCLSSCSSMFWTPPFKTRSQCQRVTLDVRSSMTTRFRHTQPSAIGMTHNNIVSTPVSWFQTFIQETCPQWQSRNQHMHSLLTKQGRANARKESEVFDAIMMFACVTSGTKQSEAKVCLIFWRRRTENLHDEWFVQGGEKWKKEND